MSKKSFTTYRWAGRTAYRCSHKSGCQFDTLNLQKIEEHAALHAASERRDAIFEEARKRRLAIPSPEENPTNDARMTGVTE
jgi:hypothetical protein